MLKKHVKILAIGIVAALAVGWAASADPPDRVGRLNHIEGSVSFLASPQEEWTEATRNYPLTSGNGLWTEEDSRVEAHLGSLAIRLGPWTELHFLELDDQGVLLSLPQGLLNVRLRELDPGESFRIETPTLRVALRGAGSYRIEVYGNGDTQAVVTQGELEAVREGRSHALRARQAAFASWSDLPSVQIRRAPPADDWDRWCAERDRREDRLASSQYVPRSMVGCEDLDWYGSWRSTPDYGMVWVPSSLPQGWAPYRFGRWAWVQPWGWTWVDDQPWGFAPFHYGRWALFRGVWVWVPGSIAHRPVYAPALVVFVGAGPVGAVLNGKTRWFPLGPGEAYVPPYRASRGYVQRVNVRHVRIGDHEVLEASKLRYVHRDRPQGLPVVPGQELPLVRAGAARAPTAQQREEVRAPARAATPWVDQLLRVAERAWSGAPKGAPIHEPEAKRAAKEQADRYPQKQRRQMVRVRKRLPNGQWVWVEEGVE